MTDDLIKRQDLETDRHTHREHHVYLELYCSEKLSEAERKACSRSSPSTCRGSMALPTS